MADEKEVKEVGKNCPSCKKILKRKKRYYRNGVYYCNKNCYKKVATSKIEAEQAATESK